MKRAAIAIACVITAATSTAFASTEDHAAVAPFLAGVVAKLQASGQKSLADGTVIDSIAAEDGLLLVNYRLSEVTIDGMDPRAFADAMVPGLQQYLCHTPELESLWQHDVGMKSVFKDKDGELIAAITTPPAACEGYKRPEPEPEPDLTAIERAEAFIQRQLPLQINESLRLDTMGATPDGFAYGYTLTGSAGADLASNDKAPVFLKLMVDNHMCDTLAKRNGIKEVDLVIRNVFSHEDGSAFTEFNTNTAECR